MSASENGKKLRELREIACKLVKSNPEKALSVANSIEDKRWKASVLKEIARELTKSNAERAFSIAKGIEDESYKRLALEEIIDYLVKVDIKQVEGIATHSDDKLVRRIAFDALFCEEDRLRKVMTEETLMHSKKVLNYTGDGKSKETAIFFTNATTEAEHISMQYEFMHQRGIESKMQSLAYTDEHYIYDAHETSEGKLWFKVLRKKL